MVTFDGPGKLNYLFPDLIATSHLCPEMPAGMIFRISNNPFGRYNDHSEWIHQSHKTDARCHHSRTSNWTFALLLNLLHMYKFCPLRLGLSFFHQASSFYTVLFLDSKFLQYLQLMSPNCPGIMHYFLLLFYFLNIPHSTVLCAYRHFKNIFKHRTLWWKYPEMTLKVLPLV